MSFGLTLWSIILHAMAIGAFGVFTVAVAIRRRAGPLRWPALAVGVSGICWLLSSGAILEILDYQTPVLAVVIELVGAPVVGLFWLLLLAVFEDVTPSLVRLVPAGLLLALRAGDLVLPPPQPPPGLVWWLYILGCTLLTLHAIFVLARGWRDDLVEARRRLRTPLLICFGTTTVVILGILSVSYLDQTGASQPWLSTTVLIAMGVAGVIVPGMLVEAKPALFAATARTSKTAAKKQEDDSDIAAERKLEKLMTQDEAWRQENLSVTDLAAKVGIPEYRLRRLINGRLGHRNFAAFVNSHRIEAAKARLGDPAGERIAIAQIAYDLGFGSLGPFNRAFKEAVGQTPTQWRKQAQGGDSAADLAANDKDSLIPEAAAKSPVPARQPGRNKP